MSDVQARVAELLEPFINSESDPEYDGAALAAHVAAVLAEAGLLAEHRVSGLATWRELCEKAEDERDAARAELAEVKAESARRAEGIDERARVIRVLDERVKDAERRGAVAALREAADAVDVHKSAYFIRGWLQGRAALIEGEDRG